MTGDVRRPCDGAALRERICRALLARMLRRSPAVGLTPVGFAFPATRILASNAEHCRLLGGLVSRPISSDLVSQKWFRQARRRRQAHSSAMNGEDETGRNQDGRIGRDFADGTRAADLSVCMETNPFPDSSPPAIPRHREVVRRHLGGGK